MSPPSDDPATPKDPSPSELSLERKKTPAESEGLNLQDFHPGEVGRDRRHEPRISAARIISVLPCRIDVETGFQKVNLVDCSAHGIGISAPLPMTVGEQFIVKLDLDQMPFLVYKVRNCRDEGARYRIGATLVGFLGGAKDDPDQILKILLNESRSRLPLG